MESSFSIIKGIHPGLIVARELKARRLRKGPFAISLKEYPQTLVSVTKGKRRINTNLALKIEKALDLEEGYLMILQVYYDIERIKREQNKEHPDFTILRRILFWDTNMDDINWQKQKKAVIKRVFERGNETEQNEIIRFYGKETVDNILNSDGK